MGEKRCLSPGTVVSVKAKIFDDEREDEEDRWSVQFPGKGEEILTGTVVIHFKWNHDPVVKYNYDGKPVSTKLKDLTVIQIAEQPAVSSPFEFEDAPLTIKVMNRVRTGKWLRAADADEDGKALSLVLIYLRTHPHQCLVHQTLTPAPQFSLLSCFPMLLQIRLLSLIPATAHQHQR